MSGDASFSEANVHPSSRSDSEQGLSSHVSESETLSWVFIEEETLQLWILGLPQLLIRFTV